MGNTGRATSFFDFNTDGGIASDLVKMLMDAKQPVPDWLGGPAGRRGGYGRYWTLIEILLNQNYNDVNEQAKWSY